MILNNSRKWIIYFLKKRVRSINAHQTLYLLQANDYRGCEFSLDVSIHDVVLYYLEKQQKYVRYCNFERMDKSEQCISKKSCKTYIMYTEFLIYCRKTTVNARISRWINWYMTLTLLIWKTVKICKMSYFLTFIEKIKYILL